MSAAVSFGPPAAPVIDAPNPRPPKTLEEAAQQFEALMIGQLLKEARGDQGGWLGSGDDTGDATASALAEEQFAQSLARSGGLGLSRHIVSSLAARAGQPGPGQLE